MATGDDIQLARELGAISQHLQSVDGKLGELVTYQKIQNGRLGGVEKEVAVLKDRDRQNQALHDRVKELEGRGRLYLLGIGGPVAAAIIGIVLGHG